MAWQDDDDMVGLWKHRGALGGNTTLRGLMAHSRKSTGGASLSHHLYERPLGGRWRLLAKFKAERDAVRAMLDLPVKAADYLILSTPMSEKELAA